MKNLPKTVKKNLKFTALIFLFISGNTFSQDTTAVYYRHELTLGGGYIYGFEKDIFNISDDDGINSAAGLNLNYCYSFSSELSAGVRLFGYIKSLPGYNVINQSGISEEVDFVMKMFNYFGEFRYTFKRGSIEPYCFISGGAALGTVTGNNEKLKASGFSIGAGAGIKIDLGNKIKFSAELIGTLGSAKWESRPFINSSGDKYNPSMFCIFIGISQYIGSPQK